ncbi:ring-cleaving dioxygenase [Paenibacillus dauci]|uniref:ring-cleaving dioxygenase n=1 Tax=Paenibacillus dauci TaxID=1567106 RepID=UPI000619D25F|nr:ring-cleaving dioxygenase [Paenibacillus dauci]
MELLGIHHVSIMTGKAEKNFEFYTKVMGMRLVKKGVNQDDTTSYHLFYGDGVASPGSELTFFDLPGIGPTYQGVSSISASSLRVADTAALQYWSDRFDSLNVTHEEIKSRAGRDTLAFQDFEGTRLILVADNNEQGVAPGQAWSGSDVPVEYGILGLGPVTLTVANPENTVLILTEILGFRHVGSYPSLAGEQHADIQVYATGEGGAGAEVHIETRPELPFARLGRGGVHHVAFRVPNEEQYNAWSEKLSKLGIPNSGKVDRHYFRALYFREPNGILFELSTDTPGFDIDESMDSLGETLSLPPFLEPHRTEIEAKLRPLVLQD